MISTQYTNENFFIHSQSEILYQDINEAQAAYEDLHINVSADSYDKIDAAVALIELLLAPVSVSPACIFFLPPVNHFVFLPTMGSYGP